MKTKALKKMSVLFFSFLSLSEISSAQEKGIGVSIVNRVQAFPWQWMTVQNPPFTAKVCLASNESQCTEEAAVSPSDQVAFYISPTNEKFAPAFESGSIKAEGLVVYIDGVLCSAPKNFNRHDDLTHATLKYPSTALPHRNIPLSDLDGMEVSVSRLYGGILKYAEVSCEIKYQRQGPNTTFMLSHSDINQACIEDGIGPILKSNSTLHNYNGYSPENFYLVEATSASSGFQISSVSLDGKVLDADAFCPALSDRTSDLTIEDFKDRIKKTAQRIYSTADSLAWHKDLAIVDQTFATFTSAVTGNWQGMGLRSSSNLFAYLAEDGASSLRLKETFDLDGKSKKEQVQTLKEVHTAMLKALNTLQGRLTIAHMAFVSRFLSSFSSSPSCSADDSNCYDDYDD